MSEEHKQIIAVGYAMGLDCDNLAKIIDQPPHVIYNWGRTEQCVTYQERFNQWQKCLEIVNQEALNG